MTDYVVSNGQTSTGLVLGLLDKLTVLSGGTAIDTTVPSFAQDIVSSGGHAIGTTLSGGFEELIFGGTATGTLVGFGAVQLPVDGGVASAATVASSGWEAVESGGTAIGTVVSGGTALVFSGGLASGTVVSGGSEIVFSGGVASGTVVSAGGSEVVSSGGTEVNPVIAGGKLELGAGATTSGPIAFSSVLGGQLQIDSTSMPANTITGFGATDTIDLVGQAADGVSYQNGVLRVTEGSQPVVSFTVPGNFNSHSFQLISDDNGGTDIALNDIAVFDTTTQQSIPARGQPYSGPVKGLQQQYIYSGSDNVNISVSDDNWFLHGGPGEDALQAFGGYNVLDGDGGSNFLTGGSGSDTFFIDDSNPSSDIWSTANNFHQGDDATVFGLASAANVQWSDNQGAAGYTGVTMHVAEANRTASLTLPGYSVSDLSNGRLGVQFGSEPDSTPFMHIIASG